MKIIQVTSYYPPRLGGMQNVVRELAERLSSDGEDVLVCTSTIDSKGMRHKSKENLQFRYVRGFDFAHTAITPLLPFALLTAPKNSVFHIHAPRPYTLEVAAAVAKLRGIPYIVHVHSGIQPMGFFKFLIAPYQKYVWRAVMRGAAKTIFLTPAQEAEFTKMYRLDSPTAVVPNGVDEKFFLKRQPRKKGNVPKILFVGRLNHHKNIPLMIEAVSRMKTPVEFNIVGDGEMQNELAALIKAKHLTKKVFLRGGKVGDELLQYYRDSDVCLMASKSEGFSLSLLEAMAAGLTIVATDSPGLADFVGKSGVIVKNDAAAIAHSLDALLADSKRMTTLSQRAVEKARQYEWRIVIQKLKDIYSEVVHE